MVGFNKYYPREGEEKKKFYEIGCYGYDSTHPDVEEDGWIGVQDGHINALIEMMNNDDEMTMLGFEELPPILEAFKENMNNRNLSTAILGWSLRGDVELQR